MEVGQMNDKCRNCKRKCLAPNIITNGKLCCEKEKPARQENAVCSQCGGTLKLHHFAYEGTSGEFWCESCIREFYDDGAL